MLALERPRGAHHDGLKEPTVARMMLGQVRQQAFGCIDINTSFHAASVIMVRCLTPQLCSQIIDDLIAETVQTPSRLEPPQAALGVDPTVRRRRFPAALAQHDEDGGHGSSGSLPSSARAGTENERLLKFTPGVTNLSLSAHPHYVFPELKPSV